MKFKKLKVIAYLLFISAMATATPLRPDTANTFSITNALQSNMVVQQKKPLRVWGKAPAGDAVEVHADWTNKVSKTKAGADGKWVAEIKVPAAIKNDFLPHSMVIIHNGRGIRFTNILIGDVWFASGQSNMQFPMDSIPHWSTGILNFRQEIAAAHYPNIRLFKSDMGIEFSPQDTIKGGEWEPCTPKSVAGFSAVAYFFGRELYKKLQIPIGMVGQAIPATSAQNFTDVNVLLADTILKKKYVDPYIKAVDSIKAKNDKATTISALQYPGLVYNKMIYPFQNLSIKGFIWYQGESNNEDGKLYTRLSDAMIKNWRGDFEQGDLPFFFVQMTPYKWGKSDSTLNWYAKFREAQEYILKIKNTGMAVTMDIGEPDNIHPLNKQDVGIRLAKVALKKTYGEDIVWRGPQFKSFKVEGSTVKVIFDKASIAAGLKTIDGKAPRHFYIAGADKKFYPATARIVNNQVWVSAAQVQQPVAVRYAFTNFPVTNLANSAGLPAAPFRTDMWDN